MDCQKIGLFIAKRRKELGMTQQQLADKLYITDRAVSKWERGAGLPDISLLMGLSDALDISVNELLAGERIEVMSKEKADEITTTSVKAYSRDANRKGWVRVAVIVPMVLVFLCVAVLGLGELAKGTLPSFSGIGNMIQTKRLLRALEQGDLDALDRMLDRSERLIFLHVYDISDLPDITWSIGGEQVTIGGISYQLALLIDGNGIELPVEALIIDTKTVDGKIIVVQQLVLTGQDYTYRLARFGYEDDNYFAEYEITFYKDGEPSGKAWLWVVWENGVATDMHLRMEGIGNGTVIIDPPTA